MNPRPFRRFPASVVAVALALLASTACRDWRVPPLAHTRPSAEGVARAVLEALRARDDQALQDLALSEQEFRDHVWPELPASRPERNLPFSYVWGDLRQKSQLALAGTLARHGGQPYELLRLEYGATTKYDSFVVHRDIVVVLRGPGADGQRLRLFGSILEKGHAFKVFSYLVDD